jgi:hypothetical protein
MRSQGENKNGGVLSKTRKLGGNLKGSAFLL